MFVSSLPSPSNEALKHTTHKTYNSVTIEEAGKKIELRNFIGQKVVRTVRMFDGCTVEKTDVKDELVVTGNDINLVSQSGTIHDTRYSLLTSTLLDYHMYTHTFSCQHSAEHSLLRQGHP